MAIDFDTSSLIRRPSDRVALVRAVLRAHPSDEAEWLEWKLLVPLDEAEGRFTVAKHILGFGNRSPSDAARFVGGHAFLLIGAEPGNLVGTIRRDPAELEDWLRPYLGMGGPVWDVHHVGLEGKEVLIVEVQPPRDGDPIHPLKRRFNQWHEGSVFVRHKGKTEPATSADIAMLTKRASTPAAGQRVAVEVAWTTEGPIVPALDLSEDRIVRFVEVERRRLLAPLETPTPKPSAKAAPAESPEIARLLAGLAHSAAQRQQIFGMKPEDREPNEYRKEVEGYLDEVRQRAGPSAVGRLVARPESLLGVMVRNPTDSNFHRVKLVLRIEGEVQGFDPDDMYGDLPAPPRLWGTMRPAMPSFGLGRDFTIPLTRPAITPRPPSMWIDNSGSARVEFAAFDLRPRAVEPLEPFLLLAAPSLAGRTITVGWEATSTNAEGVASGSLTARVTERPMEMEDLLSQSETGVEET